MTCVPGLGRELVQPALLDVRAGGDDQRVDAVEARREGGDRLAVGDVEPVPDHAGLVDRAPRGGVDGVAGGDERVRRGEPDPARRADDDDRPHGARKTLNSGGGGPPASRAKASGPSSSGRTSGRSSPSEACPLTSHSKACSKSGIV